MYTDNGDDADGGDGLLDTSFGVCNNIHTTNIYGWMDGVVTAGGGSSGLRR